MTFLTLAYLWIKAFHLIAVISWMAGLLYLPRLFVYHCNADPRSDKAETFKMMEYRLFRYIMTPAMITSWVFGFLLLLTPGAVDWSGDYWIYVKLACVLALTGVHGFLGLQVKIFAGDQNRRSAVFFRILNEAPTILMIAIVIFVVVKPF